jgi:putative transposase
MRNVLSVVPQGGSEMVATAIQTVFAQPDPTNVREQFDVIAGMLDVNCRRGKAERMKPKKASSISRDSPQSHWR